VKPLIDAQAACKLLGGISQKTLNRMVNAKEIPYVLIRRGKRKRIIGFNEDLLEKWSESRTWKPRKVVTTGVTTEEGLA